MSEIVVVIGAVITILLGLLGIEKRKNKKKDGIIKDQEVEIENEKKQSEVLKINQEVTSEAHQTLEKMEETQKVVEQKMEEAKTDEEIIDIANSIVTNFNRMSDDSKK